MSIYRSNFQELECLGYGGFSAVFKVVSLKDRLVYAIKKIPYEEENENTKISKEIELLSKLESDYVVKYYSSWIEDNYYLDTSYSNISDLRLLFSSSKLKILHIQMELCQFSLSDVIQQLNYEQKNTMNRNTYLIATEILFQLLICLNYIHTLETPLIHRDLKPENIMIHESNKNQCIKLTDFGLSTFHEFNDQTHTKDIGTLLYRAPESKSGKYDTKSDIYSLGILVQQLFNIDINESNVNVDDQLAEKYEHMFKVSIQCLNTKSKERPSCKDILVESNIWKYQIKDFNLFEKLYSELYDYKNYNEESLINHYGEASLGSSKQDNTFKMISIDEPKDFILKHNALLSRTIDLDKLITFLRSLNCFNTTILDSIKGENKQIEYIMCDMFNLKSEMDLRFFIHILLHTNNDAMAILLHPPCMDLIDFERSDPVYGLVSSFSLGNVKKPDILWQSQDKANISTGYLMDKSPRGYCVLVNNYFTVGTFLEMQRLRNIFFQLHFKVIMEKNLTAKQLIQRLLIISNRYEDLKKHNAFVFLIISHGNDNKEILGFDGKKIKISQLIEIFDNENCPELKNKPRIFFFNCCRGLNIEYGVPNEYSLSQNPFLLKMYTGLPNISDFMICYSKVDSYAYNVDWDKETYFGNTLADCLVENAYFKDFNGILLNVNKKLLDLIKETTQSQSGVKQPIEWQMSFTKKLYFFPAKPRVIKIKEKTINII